MRASFALGPLAVLMIAAAACSISGRDIQSETTAPPPVIAFETRDLGGGMRAPVPTGWTAPDPGFPRVFRPPEDGVLDRTVTLWWVDTPCGGQCMARNGAEWERLVASGELAQFEEPEAFAAIRREVRLADGLLVEAENNFGVVALSIARWNDGASSYLACRASVPAEHAGLIADFEAACLTLPAPAAE